MVQMCPAKSIIVPFKKQMYSSGSIILSYNKSIYYWLIISIIRSKR